MPFSEFRLPVFSQRREDEVLDTRIRRRREIEREREREREREIETFLNLGRSNSTCALSESAAEKVVNPKMLI
jgi:hypothetical protein